MRRKVRNYTSVVLSIGLFSAVPYEDVDALRNLKEVLVVPVCTEVPENDFIVKKYESKNKRLVIRGLHCWET